MLLLDYYDLRSSGQGNFMAIKCENCGGIVTPDLETVVMSADKWYAHRKGTCRGCGSAMQWHRPITGRLGSGYLYQYSRPPQRCSPSCHEYSQSTGLAAQI